MKKIIERVVADNTAPGPFDLWVDTSSENPSMKVNLGNDKSLNGWKTIAGGGGSDSGGGSSSGSSVMLIEMEKTEGLGEFKPKTIPDGFADEAAYFDYVWGKVRDGEVALYFKYQDENLETGGPKDVVLPLGFAAHYVFEAYLTSGTLDWFHPEE